MFLGVIIVGIGHFLMSFVYNNFHDDTVKGLTEDVEPVAN